MVAQCAFGDTLVLIPALRALRRAWPQACTVFISEPGSTGRRVAAAEVLAGTGLVDRFEYLGIEPAPGRRLLNRLGLVLRLRRHTWDLGLVLVPPVPPLTVALLQRLSRYLRLFGARLVLAPERILAHVRDAGGGLEPLPHVSVTLLDFLQRCGVPTEGCLDVPFLPPSPGASGAALAEALLAERQGELPAASLRLAIAPGAQMSSKRWPLERYAELLRRLRASLPTAPRLVTLGGEADREACAQLCREDPRAVCVIGQPIPAVIEIMRRCDAYIGNDTGLMHLAAALGKPCVAVFGSRDAPGAWYPHGAGHHVFRTRIACEGCLASLCPRGDNACLLDIGVDAVHAACLELCRDLQALRIGVDRTPAAECPAFRTPPPSDSVDVS